MIAAHIYGGTKQGKKAPSLPGLTSSPEKDDAIVRWSDGATTLVKPTIVRGGQMWICPQCGDYLVKNGFSKHAPSCTGHPRKA